MAKGSGTLSVSINEYSYSVGNNVRIVCYNDIAFEKGDVFTVTVPAFRSDEFSDAALNGSKVEYLLVDKKGNVIAPDISLSGADAENAYFDINVYGDGYGFVFGSERISLGDYAEITAVLYQGYEFEGWYVEGKKISSEANYRFRPEKDMDIYAKFMPNDIFTQNVKVKVKTDKNKYAVGETVKVDGIITNMHPSETMKDVQVITVVYDEVEHKRWENNKSGLTLAQGESKIESAIWSTENAKPGKYKVEVAAYISKGNTPVFIFDEVEFEIVEEKTAQTTPDPTVTSTPENDEETEDSEERQMQKDIFILVTTDKRIYSGNDVITYKVEYYNLTDSQTGEFELSTQVPTYKEVLEAGRGVVEGNTIKWKISNLNKNGSGEITYKVKINEIPNSEVKIKNKFEVKDEKLINPKNALSTIEGMARTGRHGNIIHKSYINGYPDNSFKPDNHITRAEIATILANVMGLSVPDNIEETGFKDVDKNHWAARYIKAVTDAGIFKGYEDSTFRPNETISRTELATVIFKCLDLDEKKAVKSSFTDTKGHWASDFIEEVSRNKIIRGYEDGSFKPNGKVTRAEAVVMINNMLYRDPINVDSSKFTDLDKKHWAFGHIEAAAEDYEFKIDEDGGKVLVN